MCSHHNSLLSSLLVSPRGSPHASLLVNLVGSPPANQSAGLQGNRLDYPLVSQAVSRYDLLRRSHQDSRPGNHRANRLVNPPILHHANQSGHLLLSPRRCQPSSLVYSPRLNLRDILRDNPRGSQLDNRVVSHQVDPQSNLPASQV